MYYYGKIPPSLRGSVDVSTLGGPSPRLGCKPREIRYIYHKGALVVNGPRRSPSLIMKRNNMDSRCLKCFFHMSARIRMTSTHRCVLVVKDPGVVFVLVMVI